MTLTPKPELTVQSGLRWHIKNDAMQSWEPQICAKTSDIDIFDAIGKDVFGGGVSLAEIKSELDARAGQDVVVNLNSPGGDVFEGVAMYNLFANHDGKVTMNVLGLAASAAPVIAMAADELVIAESANLMIHNAWTLAVGNKNDMRELADQLDGIDNAMVGVYEARTGLSRTEIASMMDSETFIIGRDAVEMGFADAILANKYLSEDKEKNGPETRARAVNELALRAYAPEMTRSERKSTMNSAKPSAGETDKPSAVEAKPSAGIEALSGLLEAIKA